MRIPLTLLAKFLDSDATAAQMAEVLTQRGIETEWEEMPGKSLEPFVVAEIVSCEKHPNADTLSLCTVDTGDGREVVQVVCGAPNVRVGLKVVFASVGTVMPDGEMEIVARKIRKIKSYGMICSGLELGISEEQDEILELPDHAQKGLSFAAWMGLDVPVIKVAPLPNRSDCLSVLGVARELAAAGLGELIQHPTPHNKPQHTKHLTVSIKNENACPYFSVQLITELTNCSSPDWLRTALQGAGLRSISAIVDITNYVMLCLGQPLHAFDADNVHGAFEIVQLTATTPFQGLNQNNYDLPAGTCVIRDDKGILSIAGIKGGLASGCSMTTKSVCLEAANFNPVCLSTTSSQLGLSSESSLRFTRGVDPTQTSRALAMAAELLQQVCGGKIGPVTEAGKLPSRDCEVQLRWTRVTQILGFDLPQEEVSQKLTTAGFQISPLNDDSWLVQVPAWRPDCQAPINLIEEIIRLEGYETIPAKQQSVIAGLTPALPASRKSVLASKKLLASRGLHEIVSYAFIPQAEAQSFSSGTESLLVANPIISHLDSMRPSLLPNLLRACKYDQQNSQMRSALFEVAEVYSAEHPGRQIRSAALVRCGAFGETDWCNPTRSVNLHDVKNDLGALLSILGIEEGCWQIRAQAPAWYDPNASATVTNERGKVLGYFGNIAPAITQELGFTVPLVAAEVNLDQVLDTERRVLSASRQVEENKFPVVRRDFTFVVDEDVAAGDVLSAIQHAESEVIEDVILVSQYRDGEKLGSRRKSLSYRVLLRFSAGVLTGKEIRKISDKIARAVETQIAGKVEQI